MRNRREFSGGAVSLSGPHPPKKKKQRHKIPVNTVLNLISCLIPIISFGRDVFRRLMRQALEGWIFISNEP
jgi:hypothetical protein